MIESIHGRHPRAVQHNAESHYETVDGKFQLVVEGTPTAVQTLKSNKVLNFGEFYLRRRESLGNRSKRTGYTVEQHGVTDGFNHSNTFNERNEADAYRIENIKTRIQPSQESSRKGLRNMD